jgi:hypothetical protein
MNYRAVGQLSFKLHMAQQDYQANRRNRAGAYKWAEKMYPVDRVDVRGYMVMQNALWNGGRSVCNTRRGLSSFYC